MKTTDNPDFTLPKKVARLALRLVRTPLGPTRKKFCYVHVPKCGGNSVALAFINRIPVTHRFTWVAVGETRQAVSLSEVGHIDEAQFHDDGPNGEKVYALRRQIANTAMALDHDYVGGHFLFDPQSHDTFSDRYAWVTILRDPVSRMISHYREELRSGFTDLSLEEYLDTDMANAHATVITRYLAGWDGKTLPSENGTETALANLEKFSAIGFLDDLAPFEKRVSDIAGKRFTLGHSRSGTTSTPDISDDTLERMQTMCRSDADVYAEAHRRFGG